MQFSPFYRVMEHGMEHLADDKLFPGYIVVTKIVTVQQSDRVTE